MGQKLALETGKLRFVPLTWQTFKQALKESHAVLFVWTAETSVANVFFWRSITLRLGWPPVKYVECFRNREEEK